MPRYFIHTDGDVAAHDDQGLVLSGPDELARVLRQTLATLLHDESARREEATLTAEAYDDSGRGVLIVRASMRTYSPDPLSPA